MSMSNDMIIGSLKLNLLLKSSLVNYFKKLNFKFIFIAVL